MSIDLLYSVALPILAEEQYALNKYQEKDRRQVQMCVN